MSSQIKGLSQFIADVRAASTSEAERARILAEIASLRKKIASGKVGTDGTRAKDGYECRKLVSKILFVYLLGYDVDFGCSEMVALVHMPRFAEKHIGYLALSLLHAGRADLRMRTMDAVEADLSSPHEYLTSLALNYVSQVADVALLSDTFIDRVFQLMVSPTSTPSVVKKAALCLAAFFRRASARMATHPDFGARLERALALFSNAPPGVCISVTAFLRAVAAHTPEAFAPHAYRVCLQKASEVFGERDPRAADYRYYDVPAPWLLVQLCELLTQLHMDVASLETNRSDVELASELVEDLLQFCMRDVEELEYTGAAEAPLQHRNARTMVLVAACKLAQQLSLFDRKRELAEDVLDLVRAQLQVKSANHRYFALELLKYVPATGDQDLPQRVLTFTRDRDIGIRALALDVLYSCVTHDTVEFVSKELLDVLAASDLQTRPQMVAQLAGMAAQFTQNAEWYVDTCAALLILGGSQAGDALWPRLVRFVVGTPSVQAHAVASMHATLAGREARSAKQSAPFVCAAAFVLGEYARLYDGDVLDLVVVLQDTVDAAGAQAKSVLLTAYAKIAAAFPAARPAVADILDVYMHSTNFETQQRAVEYRRLLMPEHEELLPRLFASMDPFGKPAESRLLTVALAPAQQQPQLPHPSLIRDLLSSNWEFGFKRMLLVDKAVLYQDALLQIGCVVKFSREHGTVVLHLKNTSSFNLTSIAVAIANPMPDSVLRLRQVSTLSTSLSAGDSTSQEIACDALQPFALTPTCRVSYFSGTLAECKFKLPIVLEKFMTPSVISAEQFAQRWAQLGPDMEFRKTFSNMSASRGAPAAVNDAELVTALNYSVVPDAAAAPAICGAGILHTKSGGMFGCLLHLEPDKKRESYTATVRSTHNRLVSVVLVNNVAHAYQL